MRILCLSLAVSWIAAEDLQFTSLKTLEAVPDDSEYFLQLPGDTAIDDQGNYYVADWLARVVFIWDAQGVFKGVVGRPGEGPGEFVFRSIGGPQAYLGIVDRELYVYDGGKRSVEIFDLEGRYRKSVPVEIQSGRTESFYITPKGQFIVYHKSFMKETPTMEVAIMDGGGKPLKVLKSFEDQTFKRQAGSSGVRGVVINAYSAELATAFNADQDEIIVGFMGEPAFGVFSMDGSLKRKVPFALIQRDVTKEDIAEFNEQSWIKNNAFFSTQFPEKMPFYQKILPIADRGYLVCHESPFFHKVEGILVNATGKTLGKVKFHCGENGTLLSYRGRLIAIQTDEDGDFQIQEMSLTSS